RNARAQGAGVLAAEVHARREASRGAPHGASEPAWSHPDRPRENLSASLCVIKGGAQGKPDSKFEHFPDWRRGWQAACYNEIYYAVAATREGSLAAPTAAPACARISGRGRDRRHVRGRRDHRPRGAAER